MRAGAAFAPLVGTDQPAWDVWMLFDSNTTWRQAPPVPAWWEHQLGGLTANRYLDPERFAERARGLERSDRGPAAR